MEGISWVHFQAGGDSSWAPGLTAMLLLYWGPRLAIAFVDLSSPQSSDRCIFTEVAFSGLSSNSQWPEGRFGFQGSRALGRWPRLKTRTLTLVGERRPERLERH